MCALGATYWSMSNGRTGRLAGKRVSGITGFLLVSLGCGSRVGGGRDNGRSRRGRLRTTATRRQDGQHEREQQRRVAFPSRGPVHGIAPLEQRVLGQLLL